MKKRVIALVAALIVLFIAEMLVIEWMKHTWGPDQAAHAMWFMLAAQSSLAPLVFYLRYRWQKPMSPPEARAYKRVYIPLSIGFFLLGLGALVNGLWNIDVLPIELGYRIVLGLFWLSIVALLGAGILYLRDPDMGKPEEEQADRPGAEGEVEA